MFLASELKTVYIVEIVQVSAILENSFQGTWCLVTKCALSIHLLIGIVPRCHVICLSKLENPVKFIFEVVEMLCCHSCSWLHLM